MRYTCRSFVDKKGPLGPRFLRVLGVFVHFGGPNPKGFQKTSSSSSLFCRFYPFVFSNEDRDLAASCDPSTGSSLWRFSTSNERSWSWRGTGFGSCCSELLGFCGFFGAVSQIFSGCLRSWRGKLQGFLTVGKREEGWGTLGHWIKFMFGAQVGISEIWTRCRWALSHSEKARLARGNGIDTSKGLANDRLKQQKKVWRDSEQSLHHCHELTRGFSLQTLTLLQNDVHMVGPIWNKATLVCPQRLRSLWCCLLQVGLGEIGLWEGGQLSMAWTICPEISKTRSSIVISQKKCSTCSPWLPPKSLRILMIRMSS